MESKATVRRRHRAQRAQLSHAESAARGQRVAELLRAWVPPQAWVSGYMPMRGEPDVLPFLREHAQRGGQVYVPVVVDADLRRLEWVRWSVDAPLQRSALLPVMEPVGQRLAASELLPPNQAVPLTMLIPALAVDHRGGRLGQGGGFYDTLVANTPELNHRAELLAVLHSEEVLVPGSFAVEKHDLRVQRAVTPGGIIELSIATASNNQKRS